MTPCGFSTDFRLPGTGSVRWAWAIPIVAAATASNFGGSMLGAQAMGEPVHVAGQIGALTNCRGLIELAVLDVGRQLGILDPGLFAILVLMTLISTVLATPLVKFFRRKQLALGNQPSEASQ